jgi:hypothetical protein
MKQVSQKTATKSSFEYALWLKQLQTKKIQALLDQEKDGKFVDILHRMLREEHHHITMLEEKTIELRLD